MMTKTQFAKMIVSNWRKEYSIPDDKPLNGEIYKCSSLAVALDFLGELNIEEMEYAETRGGTQFTYWDKEQEDCFILSTRDIMRLLPDCISEDGSPKWDVNSSKSVYPKSDWYKYLLWVATYNNSTRYSESVYEPHPDTVRELYRDVIDFSEQFAFSKWGLEAISPEECKMIKCESCEDEFPLHILKCHEDDGYFNYGYYCRYCESSIQSAMDN